MKKQPVIPETSPLSTHYIYAMEKAISCILIIIFCCFVSCKKERTIIQYKTTTVIQVTDHATSLQSEITISQAPIIFFPRETVQLQDSFSPFPADHQEKQIPSWLHGSASC